MLQQCPPPALRGGGPAGGRDHSDQVEGSRQAHQLGLLSEAADAPRRASLVARHGREPGGAEAAPASVECRGQHQGGEGTICLRYCCGGHHSSETLEMRTNKAGLMGMWCYSHTGPWTGFTFCCPEVLSPGGRRAPRSPSVLSLANDVAGRAHGLRIRRPDVNGTWLYTWEKSVILAQFLFLFGHLQRGGGESNSFYQWALWRWRKEVTDECQHMTHNGLVATNTSLFAGVPDHNWWIKRHFLPFCFKGILNFYFPSQWYMQKEGFTDFSQLLWITLKDPDVPPSLSFLITFKQYIVQMVCRIASFKVFKMIFPLLKERLEREKKLN